jgi:hypothetical protein
MSLYSIHWLVFITETKCVYCTLKYNFVPWLRRLVAGLAPRKPGLDPRSFPVRFVVNKVALRQVFPCQCLSTKAPYSAYVLLVPEGQAGEAWEPSDKHLSAAYRWVLDSKVVCVLSLPKGLIEICSVVHCLLLAEERHTINISSSPQSRFMYEGCW